MNESRKEERRFLSSLRREMALVRADPLHRKGLPRAVAPLAFGYARQPPGGPSVRAQARAIRSYCTAKSLALKEIYADVGVTGRPRLLDREGGLRLMAALHPGDHVVLPRLDVAFPSLLDGIATLKHWGELGAAIHVLDLAGAAVSTAGPGGDQLLAALIGVAQWEHDLRHQRRLEARATAATHRKEVARPRRGSTPPWE